MSAQYIACIGTYAHGRQVTSLLCQSDIIITCHISAYSGTLENKMWYLMVSKKQIHYSGKSRIEKSVPRDVKR